MCNHFQGRGSVFSVRAMEYCNMLLAIVVWLFREPPPSLYDIQLPVLSMASGLGGRDTAMASQIPTISITRSYDT